MENKKKQNRGTKFAWFAFAAFFVAAVLAFCSMTVTTPFDGSTSIYATNAGYLSGLVMLPFVGSVIVFLLFRLCTCGFKKASKVYRINVISMLLLLFSYLVILWLSLIAFLPLMQKTKYEILNGSASYSGHGFLALFSGHNDWLIYLMAFGPIAFLVFYVLMYVLMVKAAKEVRLEIKAVKTAKAEKNKAIKLEKKAKKEAERRKIEEEQRILEEKKKQERIALQEKKAEEKKRLEEKRALSMKKKEEEMARIKEERALSLKKKEERTRIRAEKEIARRAKNEVPLETAELNSGVSNEFNDENDKYVNDLFAYDERKKALKPAYFVFLITIIPIFILQLVCLPGNSSGSFRINDYGDLYSLFMLGALIYFVLNLIFVIKSLINTKKMTLALRVLTFSSITVQTMGVFFTFFLNFVYGDGNFYYENVERIEFTRISLIVSVIFFLLLLIATIVLLTVYKKEEKIKNYISLGAIALLFVFEGALGFLRVSSFFFFKIYDLAGAIIFLVILVLAAIAVVLFSKKLSEGYFLSKTLPSLGKKPRLLTSEEKLSLLQKEYKKATKEGNTEKANELNAQIQELSLKTKDKGKSSFDGRLIQLIGYRLLGRILTGITFGLGYPWAKCFVESWSTKHQVIDGKRLSFNGKGIQLFGKYIIWLLLSVVTFGIYAFWLAIKMKKWVVSHTHIKENKVDEKNTSSNFDGRLIQLIGYNILTFIMTVFTLGIAYPWAICLKENWYAKHTVVDGNRLKFDGNGLQLFGKYIIWLLLSIVTFGIYAFWLAIKMKKWVVSHTHFSEEIEASNNENNDVVIDSSEIKENKSWTCPNCGIQNQGNFCCECGTKKPE